MNTDDLVVDENDPMNWDDSANADLDDVASGDFA